MSGPSASGSAPFRPIPAQPPPSETAQLIRGLVTDIVRIVRDEVDSQQAPAEVAEEIGRHLELIGAIDAPTQIANEIYRYAELIDAGRFDDVGEMMEHCQFRFGNSGAAGPRGAEAIAAMYHSMVVIHDDGTPRTQHVTSNPIITIDGDTAQARSRYTVLQQVGDGLLETIVCGRYFDTLARIDGRWRFTERRFMADLIGDLSRHMHTPLSREDPHGRQSR